MEMLDPASSDASCLRCSGGTVESRSMILYAPFLTWSGVTVFGGAKDSSALNFSRDFSTSLPQEPFRPTSKTLGQEIAVAPCEREASEDLFSNMLASKSTTGESCGLLDIQPSQGRAGRGTTGE